MRRVILSAIVVFLSIGAAFANAVRWQGYYLWDANTQHYVWYHYPPLQEKIDVMCWGSSYDCYYILDETGSVKTCVRFRDL